MAALGPKAAADIPAFAEQLGLEEREAVRRLLDRGAGPAHQALPSYLN